MKTFDFTTLQVHHAMKLQLDPIPDANGFHTLRPHDGTENGDTDVSPVATVYREGNAHRLAACWNACIGLDLPEDVPPGIFRELRDACENLLLYARDRGPREYQRAVEVLAQLDAPAAGKPAAEPSREDLVAALRDALGTLKLVDSSGPLHAGLTDENTLAEVVACLKRYNQTVCGS